MSRAWKPGDVATASAPGLPDFLVFRMGGAYWSAPRDWPSGVDPRDCDYRRLVVIDPEDESAVRRLVKALYLDTDPSDLPATWQAQAALREFADPKPPKPAEPTGLGAVVEDADGKRWVKTGYQPQPWQLDASRWENFPEIDVVKVLSEGVTS